MNNLAFSKMNKIPVRTKSWLGVNEITLDKYAMPEIKKFNNIKVNFNESGVDIKEVKKCENLSLNKEFIYGVNKEVINQGENDFNSSYIIEINRNIKVNNPIIIEYNLNEENKTLIDNLVIKANENSQATVVIAYMSEDGCIGYHNGLCKIISENNSSLNIVKINLLNKVTSNFDSNASYVQYGGNVKFTYIDLGGINSITNFHGDLLADNSNCELSSIYLGEKDKVIDINYVMTHKGRRSSSKIITKGALKDKAKKTFKGTLDFKRGATKSTGEEEEYCMLLSPNAKSQAIPLLLCEEDDVSGQHAASAGKINEDKLFYLMCRGLSLDEARKLIIETEFNPIIDRIPVERMKNKIYNEIKRRLVNE